MFTSHLVPMSDSAGGTGGTLITNTLVIAAITNPDAWDDSGDYAGSTTGLVEGNFYFDDILNQKYEYLNGKLRRYNFNLLSA